MNDTTFVVWAKGSHRAIVYVNSDPTPAAIFTFAEHKETASQLDFTTALSDHFLYEHGLLY
jgi:hypothetical protein